MIRKKLENYLGKMVTVVLFDSYTVTGILCKTGIEKYKNNPNLYIPKNRYFIEFPHLINAFGNHCISPLFRCSHVKKLTEVHSAKIHRA
jgi:hypothetical protein